MSDTNPDQPIHTQSGDLQNIPKPVAKPPALWEKINLPFRF
jgi:hypothetical protein